MSSAVTQVSRTADVASLNALGVELLSWADAMELMDWQQGEHVTLIGPTGVGKTEAMVHLLDQRGYVCFVTTKKRDETQDLLLSRGYRKESAPEMVNAGIARKFLFSVKWNPKADYRSSVIPMQRAIVDKLLTRLFDRGAWTIALDELPYVADQLGLKDTLRLLWLQGRSARVSVIANTQRPRNVPLEAYSQATHLFIWNTPDSQDILRSGDLVALDRAVVLDVLRACGKHDVLYVQPHTGAMCVTNTRK